MIGWILKLFLGNYNDRILKKIMPTLDKVNSFSERMGQMTDDELKNQTNLLKEKYANGETLESLLPEAFATLREASARVLGMRHFDVQIIGGIVLFGGNISEMRTGEGKTLAATLPIYLHALTGKGVHVVTVNDYLAKRDCEWMNPLYYFMGLSAGALQSSMDNHQRKEIYNLDIVYGTTSEFGFDYLRDNMVNSAEMKVQRGQYFCLVDEVDSVLIDEARTPLIISGPAEGSIEKYYVADKIIPSLKAATRGADGKWIQDSGDFILEEKDRHISLTEVGIASVEKFLNIDDLFSSENIELVHAINQSLRAHHLYKSGREYLVEQGQVIIVDENTGRKMEGRRYSDGLHQAIEAKENVRIQRENQTMATITIQNYFKLYNILAGMTGTAQTEAPEFLTIYKMDVISIPTHRPVARIDYSDVIYRSGIGKYKALVKEVQRIHELGAPILIGTISVQSSEELSQLLTKHKVKHNVLNAKNHEKESEMVAQAGALGMVTIATNMAGRGTDIVLGGNPTYIVEKYLEKIISANEVKSMVPQLFIKAIFDDKTEEAEKLIKEHPQYEKLLDPKHSNYIKEVYQEWKEKHDQVKLLGGLHIIGTERHESRRIDNQLRGRAGRQGDPGYSRFYMALDDELFRLFGSERMIPWLDKAGFTEDDAIESRLITRMIEGSQKKVEARNFEIRKHLLQYDEVMNTQRKVIYAIRDKVLNNQDIGTEVLQNMKDWIEGEVLFLLEGKKTVAPDQKLSIFSRIEQVTGIELQEEVFLKYPLEKEIWVIVENSYNAKKQSIGVEVFQQSERLIMIELIDDKWKDHLYAIDELREGISLRSYAERNPLVEYQLEASRMFEDMMLSLQESITYHIFHFNFEPVNFDEKMAKKDKEQSINQILGPSDSLAKPTPLKRGEDKVGRNDICPCGSGKKYKQCHGK